MKTSVGFPVPPGYRELRPGELIREGDQMYEDPTHGGYGLESCLRDSIGVGYEPVRHHTCGRYRLHPVGYPKECA